MTCPPCNAACNQGRACPARQACEVPDSDFSWLDAEDAEDEARSLEVVTRAVMVFVAILVSAAVFAVLFGVTR